MLINVSPIKRLILATGLSIPILTFYPIKSLFLDKSDTVRPEKQLKKLINEVFKEQNLRLKNFDILVKDELDFKIYPNWLGKSTLIVPKYLNVESLKDLSAVYLNDLLKKQYDLELKDREKWYSEDGKKFISSFLMTDDAKKFLISRNLYSLQEDPTFYYFSITVLSIYIPGQLIKWHRELIQMLTDSKETTKPIVKKNNLQKVAKTSFFKRMFLRYKYSILFSAISIFLYFFVVLYYAVGLKNSRDSDAKSLSHGLANGTTIKAKTNLIDFNYYSGGEEAYRKLSERNQCLNRLFYDDKFKSDWVRFINRIPLTIDGNKFSLLSNEVPVISAYKNLNDWEKNS